MLFCTIFCDLCHFQGNHSVKNTCFHFNNTTSPVGQTFLSVIRLLVNRRAALTNPTTADVGARSSRPREGKSLPPKGEKSFAPTINSISPAPPSLPNRAAGSLHPAVNRPPPSTAPHTLRWPSPPHSTPPHASPPDTKLVRVQPAAPASPAPTHRKHPTAPAPPAPPRVSAKQSRHLTKTTFRVLCSRVPALCCPP